MTAACPDCGAAASVGELAGYAVRMVHAETCPINTGVDRAIATDRDWFARNPLATERVRRVTWAEAAEMEISAGWRPSGTVLVLQLVPGIRSRRFEPEAGAR